MGADLITAAAPAQVTTEEAHANLAKLSTEKCNYVVGEVLGWDDDELENDEARDRIAYAINEIVGDNYRRDVSVMNFSNDDKPNFWYVTGGMTWGDAPTDAYDDIVLLDWSGVTTKETE